MICAGIEAKHCPLRFKGYSLEEYPQYEDPTKVPFT